MSVAAKAINETAVKSAGQPLTSAAVLIQSVHGPNNARGNLGGRSRPSVRIDMSGDNQALDGEAANGSSTVVFSLKRRTVAPGISGTSPDSICSNIVFSTEVLANPSNR